MSLNNVTLEGTIITDLELRGQEGNECLQILLGVNKNFKAEGAQYPESVSIPVKAFKQRATFIKEHFNKLDHIIIVGEIDKDGDYTKEDGSVKRGELFVRVNQVYFCGNNKGSDNSSAPQESSAPKTTTLSAPKPNGGLSMPKTGGLGKPTLGGNGLSMPKLGK